jgi:hypothetical protein
MKKSARFLVGALIIGLALTGCPTDGGKDDPTAQLAADLNKTASGGTVTLTDRVVIASDLTVPAGVTLDLTGDGELALRDAALTVNGTVIAGPQKVRLDDSAGEGAINGSGTIQLKGKGYLLVVQGTKTLTLDGVTLAGVADNNEPLVGVSNGGALVMKSGAITGNSNIRDESADGGGVRVNGGGAFTMQGGTISGNTAKGGRYGNGGGVHINEDGTFTMAGGVISGNTAQGGGIDGGNGGGVRVNGGGAFTMVDGTISGNTAQGGNWSNGGGVSSGGTFTMQGGVISGNTAEAVKWPTGGGVEIGGSDSTFTLEGGTIYGKSDRLPDGTDPSLANSTSTGGSSTLHLAIGSPPKWARWGTGGTYTKGGVPQTGGSDIGGKGFITDETLIAIPAP